MLKWRQYRGKTSNMQPKDNGYLGGIVDGEGCISIMFAHGGSHKTPTTALAISVYQADKRLTDWLIFHYGGKVYESRMKNSTRTGYVWFAPTGKEAREKFLLLLIPNLILKREQAMLALEYVRLSRSWENRQKRLDLARRCQLLNRYVANSDKSQKKTTALEKHIAESYAGPRRDKEEPVTTNTSNIEIKQYWEFPTFTEVLNVNSMKIESELHGDMQSVPAVMPTT